MSLKMKYSITPIILLLTQACVCTVMLSSLAPLLTLSDALSPSSVSAHVIAQSYITLQASDLSEHEFLPSFLKFHKALFGLD